MLENRGAGLVVDRRDDQGRDGQGREGIDDRRRTLSLAETKSCTTADCSATTLGRRNGGRTFVIVIGEGDGSATTDREVVAGWGEVSLSPEGRTTSTTKERGGEEEKDEERESGVLRVRDEFLMSFSLS